VRAAVLTASQCVTYDEVKGRVMAATGWRDTAATHLATAMITGIVSTTATNPVDVIKTHMFVGEDALIGPRRLQIKSTLQFVQRAPVAGPCKYVVCCNNKLVAFVSCLTAQQCRAAAFWGAVTC
jgi:hypothetical protein